MLSFLTPIFTILSKLHLWLFLVNPDCFGAHAERERERERERCNNEGASRI
jgi:hypothetical protein